MKTGSYVSAFLAGAFIIFVASFALGYRFGGKFGKAASAPVTVSQKTSTNNEFDIYKYGGLRIYFITSEGISTVFLQENTDSKTSKKILTLARGFQPTGIIIPPPQFINNLFIISAQSGDSVEYFLVNAGSGSSQKIEGLRNGFNSYDSLLSLVDGTRVIGVYTDDKNDGSPVIKTYWIAPLNNLSQKQTLFTK